MKQLESPYPNADLIGFPSIRELACYALANMSGKKIALSGGSTYRKVLEHWRNRNLKQFNFYLADERVVPIDDSESNWKMVEEFFLIPNQIEQQNHPKDLEHFKSLIQFSFDQIFLGMGSDGHTASLFPGGEELKNFDDLIVETISPKAPHKRLSLSLKAISEAKEVILIVFGKTKKDIFHHFISKNEDLPITLAITLAQKAKILILDGEYDV